MAALLLIPALLVIILMFKGSIVGGDQPTDSANTKHEWWEWILAHSISLDHMKECQRIYEFLVEYLSNMTGGLEEFCNWATNPLVSFLQLANLFLWGHNKLYS